MSNVKVSGFCISSADNIPASKPVITRILNNLTRVYNRNLDVKASQKGYHTISSIMGNGRFRDLGFSAESVVDIISSINPNDFPLLFKRHNENGDLFLHREPILHAKSLHGLLTEIRQNGTLKKWRNGNLTIEYKGQSFKGYGVVESLFKNK